MDQTLFVCEEESKTRELFIRDAKSVQRVQCSAKLTEFVVGPQWVIERD